MSATESNSGTIGGDKLQQPTPPTPSLLMNKLLSTRKFAHLNQRKSACEERQRQQKEKKDTVYLLNHQERKEKKLPTRYHYKSTEIDKHKEVVSVAIFAPEGKFVKDCLFQQSGSTKSGGGDKSQGIHFIISSGPQMYNGTIKVWDIFSMQLIHTFNNHGENRVSAIATDPAFPFVISGDVSNTIIIWNPTSLDIIARLDLSQYHTKGISSLFIATKETLVTKSNANVNNGSSSSSSKDTTPTSSNSNTTPNNPGNRTSVRKGGKVTQTNSSVPEVNPLANCEAVLIVASSDKKWSAWDCEAFFHQSRGKTELKPLRHDETGHTDRVLSITAFYEDDTQILLSQQHHHKQRFLTVTSTKPAPPWYTHLKIISGSWDKTIRYRAWDDPKNKSIVLRGHTKSVTTVRCHTLVNQDRSLPILVSGSLDKTCIVWDMERLEVMRTLVGHEDRINQVHVYDKGQHSPPMVITASEDKTCIQWDLLTGRALRRFAHNSPTRCVDFHRFRRGLLVITGESNGDVNVWNMLRSERFHSFTTNAVIWIETINPFIGTNEGTSRDQPPHQADHPYKGMALIGSIDGKCRFCDIHTGKKIGPPTVMAKPRITPGDKKDEGEKVRLNVIAIYVPSEKGDGSYHANHQLSFSRKSPSMALTPAIKRPQDTHSDGSRTPMYQNYNWLKHQMNEFLIVSGDGEARMSVWSGKHRDKLRDLVHHKGAVFAICIYDPRKCWSLPSSVKTGKNRKFSSSTMSMDSESKEEEATSSSGKSIGQEPSNPFILGEHLKRPLIISGGVDKTIGIWDVLTEDTTDLPSTMTAEDGSTSIPKMAPFHIIHNAHSEFVRCLGVYHPQEQGVDPWFASGSYDKTTIIWSLRTFEAIRKFDMVHTAYVFALCIYDPIIHCGPKGNVRIQQSNSKDPLVVTGGYDGVVGVCKVNCHSSIGEEVHPDPDYIVKRFTAHKDSVTALAVYTPSSTTDDPLIITGSIDKMIIVWSLISGERLQTLFGHQDRVCYIAIYVPPDPPKYATSSDDPTRAINPMKARPTGTPLLISGSDDKKTIVWEDALHQKPFMPTRDTVYNLFLADATERNWPLITDLVMRYDYQVFVENSYLFSLAIARKRSDFLCKFHNYLEYMIPFLPALLGEAMDADDLVAVRVILMAWTKRLNEDIKDMLHQRLYHPSYFLEITNFRRFALTFPVEFVTFISGLRLVMNHPSLLDGNHTKKLPFQNRREIEGVHDPSATYQDVWEHCFEKKTAWKVLWSECKEVLFYRRSSQPQSITSLLVPLKQAASVDMLTLFVEVSNLLNRVDIFNSPVGIMALQHYWDSRGKRTHLRSMIGYIITLIAFMICVFSFRYVGDKETSGLRAEVGILVLHIGLLVIFMYYFYVEYQQVRIKIDLILDSYNVSSYHHHHELHHFLHTGGSAKEVADANAVVDQTLSGSNSVMLTTAGATQSGNSSPPVDDDDEANRDSLVVDVEDVILDSPHGKDGDGSPTTNGLESPTREQSGGGGTESVKIRVSVASAANAAASTIAAPLIGMTNKMQNVAQQVNNIAQTTTAVGKRNSVTGYVKNTGASGVPNAAALAAEIKKRKLRMNQANSPINDTTIVSSDVVVGGLVSSMAESSSPAKPVVQESTDQVLDSDGEEIDNEHDDLKEDEYTLLLIHRVSSRHRRHHPDQAPERVLEELVRTEKRDEFIEDFRRFIQIVACIISNFCLDIWNTIDMSIIMTGITGLLMRLFYNRDTEYGRVILSVTSVMMWFKVLYFMRPFSTSGPLVQMIVQVASAIRYFLIALFCLLAGFAQAFWLLSNGENADFDTIRGSLYSSFITMMGAYLPDFDATASTTSSSNSLPKVSPANDFANFLLVIFMLTMMILMLNILIAIMGDTFSRVRSTGLALWRKERASICVEDIYADASDIAPYIHVLQYTSDTVLYPPETDLITMVKDSSQQVPPFTPLPDDDVFDDDDKMQLVLDSSGGGMDGTGDGYSGHGSNNVSSFGSFVVKRNRSMMNRSNTSIMSRGKSQKD